MSQRWNQERQKLNLQGQYFGSLFVESFARNSKSGATLWNTRCLACQRTAVLFGFRLVSSKPYYCGCGILPERAGTKIGRLAISGPPVLRDGVYFWPCKCECEKLVKKTSKALTANPQASCGCLRIEKRSAKRILPDREAGLRVWLHGYQSNAKRRGIEWNLTIEEFDSIVQQNCHYCGALPKSLNRLRDCASRKEYGGVFNGLDRKNSVENDLRDYSLENILPCCGVCNRAKMDMSYEDFIIWLQRAGRYVRTNHGLEIMR